MDSWSPNLVNIGLLFREQKFFTAEICDIFCQTVTKFGSVTGSGVLNWECRLTEVVLYNGRKTVVAVVVVVVVVVVQCVHLFTRNDSLKAWFHV